MKKSLTRKLELHRETLRIMSERDLKTPDGGIQLRTGAYTNCNECHPDV